MSPRSVADADIPVIAEESDRAAESGNRTDPPRRFRLGRWILLGIGGCMLLMVGVIAYQCVKNQDRLYDISRETTYVTEYLTPQGRPDYAAAINARMGEGVTPETNAVVKLWEAIGPRPEQASMEFHKAMVAELGIDPLPEHGHYLAKIEQWLTELPDPPANLKERVQQLDAVQRGPWQTAEHPDLDAWIKRNEIPLQLVHEALQRPHYYRPVILLDTPSGERQQLFEAWIPDVQIYRVFGKLLIARAMWHLGEGRVDEAIQDLLEGHRLGRKVAQGWSIIEALVGVAIDAIMSDGDNALLVDPQLTAAQAKYYRDQLEKLGPVLTLEQMAQKIDQGERFMGLDSVVAMAHGQMGDDDLSMLGMESLQAILSFIKTVGINWNRVLREMNRGYDQFVEALKLPEREERLKALSELVKQRKELGNQLTSWQGGVYLILGGSGARGEVLANVLTAMLLPAGEQYHDAVDRSTMRYETLLVGLALAEYRRTHARYPEKLEALIPNSLREIPVDVYAGAPVIYHVSADGQEMKIYSVGRNGIDDDGIRYSDLETTGMRGDDLGFVDPIPQPPPSPEGETDTSDEATKTDSIPSDP